MPISNQYYFNQSIPLLEAAEGLQLAILEELRRINQRLINDPNYNGEQRLIQFTEQELEKFDRESQAWILATLPAAYMRGISVQDSELRRMVKNPRPPSQSIGRQDIARLISVDVTHTASANAQKVLSSFPDHLGKYAPFEGGAIGSMRQGRPHILRDARSKYQDMARNAMLPAFRHGDTATRRELSKMILNQFSRSGITSVGRLSAEAYAEREARSYTQKVAMQAQANRAMERGYDLVRLSQYAGPSPMCEPYQGKVFSLSGNSDKYPSLDSAIFAGSYDFGGGVYHDYCGHAQATYIPGVSPDQVLTDSPEENKILNQMGEARGNRFIFEQRQKQRKIEWTIRKFKRQKAVALDPKQRERADRFIKKWQGEAREHVKDNPFLKRAYVREQI